MDQISPNDIFWGKKNANIKYSPIAILNVSTQISVQLLSTFLDFQEESLDVSSKALFAQWCHLLSWL